MANYYLGDRVLNLVRVFISNRRKTPRLPAHLPLRFAIRRQTRGLKEQRSRPISARTADLSRSGLSIETSVIQIDGFHVSISADMASEQMLEIELELPEHTIHIQGLPLRHERKGSPNGNYIVGVKILSMPDEDRAIYEAYLKAEWKKL
jgi:hypothetical protein